MKGNSFLNMVIIALLVVIMLQMCNRRNTTTTQVIVNKDTVWVKKDSTIYSQPTVIIREGSRDSVLIREYLPDTNYDKLLAQYKAILNDYLAKTVQVDSLKIDSTGWIAVTDTVTKNLIVNRSYTYKLKYPIVKETITIYPPLTRQIYLGGGLAGNGQNIVDQISVGALYKDKKEHILILSGTYNESKQFGAQLQSFWKIKL